MIRNMHINMHACTTSAHITANLCLSKSVVDLEELVMNHPDVCIFRVWVYGDPAPISNI